MYLGGIPNYRDLSFQIVKNILIAKKQSKTADSLRNNGKWQNYCFYRALILMGSHKKQQRIYFFAKQQSSSFRRRQDEL